MDRAPPTPSRKAEFPWAISSRLGGYEHVETLPPDDGRPRLTTRTHSIPRKPLPKTSKVSTAEISSNQSSTCSVSDADFDRKPSEELHRDSALYLAFSVVTALVPCLFIALAIIAARLEGTPTSEWGGKVQNALLLVCVS